MANYDIIIRGGSVFDGKGGTPEVTDVALKGDKIAGIGGLQNASAEKTIDATGKYVTPGFIDVTNHSDTHLTIFKYPELKSLLMQGITTVVGGNCGASLAPLGSKEALDSIRKWADPTEMNVDWAETGEFLETLDKVRPEVNFGTLVGYGTLRRGVLGNEIRPLSNEELEKVKLLLQKALAEGALGLSLGLSYGHERASTTEEIIDVARVLAGKKGIAKLHLRSEGNGILASVNEAVRIAREVRVPVHINHLKVIGKKSWPLLKKALSLIANANQSGVSLTFDVSPYNATGSPLYLLIPAWARGGGFEELFRRIDNQDEKQKIIEGLKGYTLHYDKILVVSADVKSVVGKTIAEVAAQAELPPEEALLELVRANEGRVVISGKTIHPQNTEMAILDPASFIATDGEGYNEEEVKSGNLVHPRSFGAFPHFWHRFVNDKKLIAPEKAVVKMTSGPAERLGIFRRGVIASGNFADMVIFDPLILRDRATYKNPYRYAEGLEWVIINGKVALEKGKYVGARAGKVLRKI